MLNPHSRCGPPHKTFLLSVGKSKVKSSVSINLSLLLVRLVFDLLLWSHLIPLFDLLLVEADEPLSLGNEHNNRQAQNRYQHLVSGLIVRSIPFAVYLTRDNASPVFGQCLHLWWVWKQIMESRRRLQRQNSWAHNP